MGVRRESVELSLNDVGFSTGVAKAKAEVALLNHELGNLDGNSVRANRSTGALGDGNGGIAKVGKQARQSSSDIDKYSGRLGLLTKSVLALGPALVPISAAAIPAISGLAMGFGAAAGAAGVAVLAFNGVGDAVKAMDAYALTPTAANLAKMQQAMQNLGPAGANFARFIDGLEPQLRALQGSAREGLFPGVQQGIEELLPMLPKVEDFIGRIASEMGNLAAEAGKGLTGDAGFQKFAHYIDSEGVPIMDAFARSTGKVASGLVALAADMAPLTGDFMGGMANAADSFQKWAVGLDQTQGFRDFVSYIEQEGPQVADLLKTIASTALSIAEAFAPVGSAILPALTSLLQVLGLIAKSPLGPLVATAISLNAAISLGSLAVDKLAVAWGRVAVAAGEASVAEGRAAAIGKNPALIGGASLLAAWAAGEIASKPINAASNYGSTSLSTKNLQQVGSNLAFANPSIGGRGQGTLNGLFGAVDTVGSLVGFKGQIKGERSSASSIDRQLAGMVSAGQTKQAAAAFDILSESAKKSGASVAQVAETFPHYTAAAKAADAANKAGADSTTHLSTSAKGLSAQFREGTISLNQFRAGLASVHQEALNDFDAVTQFGAAVQAAAKQARDGAKAGLNPFTAAGNANRQAISGMVAAWNAQPAAIQNNIGKYQQMKSKLVEFMTQMGATKAQIRDLTSEINKPRKLVVQAETSEALSRINFLKGLLNGLHDKTVSISTNYTATYTNGPGLTPDIRHKADGGFISGPGGPRDDKIPARLSNGEFVVNAATTARLRPWLEHENAKGYADGGLVGRTGVDGVQFLSSARMAGYSAAELKQVAAAQKATVALDNMARATKKQLAATEKAADKTEGLLKDAADVAKQHRQAVLDDISSMRDAIAQRYLTDELSNATSGANLSGNALTPADQIRTAISAMNQDATDAKYNGQALSAIRANLTNQGFAKSQTNAVISYLAQSGTGEQIQYLATDPTLEADFARSYSARSAQATSVGAAQANAAYGAELARSTAVQRQLLAEYREVKSENKQIHAKVAAMEKHLSDIKSTAPEKTGKATADALTGVAKSGHDKGKKW